MSPPAPLGIRWTVGDVTGRGFEALRLSIWGAWKIFGPLARYAACVNTLPLGRAQERTGEVPAPVVWQESAGRLPAFLAERMDRNMAEGVGWKLAPLRLFPDRFEIALDNDCILWELPAALRRWWAGEDGGGAVLQADVRACFGRFAELCPPQALNSGIRALPPGFDFEAALEEVLRQEERRRGGPVRLDSELDEQGLQAAALWRRLPLGVVGLEEVTICSPFWPHQPHLGRCGAHFVGLNGKHIPWDYYGRPADEWMAEHWERHRAALYARVGAPGAGSSAR